MPEERPGQLGPNRRKLHPKLQMFANGSTEVNTRRAELTACMAVTDERLLRMDLSRGNYAQAQPISRIRQKQPPSLDQIPRDVLVNVFIETTDPAEELNIRDDVEATPGAHPEHAERATVGDRARRANLATATVRLSQLQNLIDREGVTYVEPGQSISVPKPLISTDTHVRPNPAARRFRAPDSRHPHGDGASVLIGIIDVQGFDFAHPDFLHADGTTRFVAIWDQGGRNRPNPNSRAADKALFSSQFNYGSEIQKADMDAAIAAQVGVAPHDLEPQSQMAPRSHGTHVASIAAGNHGLCRRAAIAAVLISLAEDDYERRRSFYDSTRIVDAVDYLFAMGKALNRPVSINISLGTNGHAHDSSSAASRWLDAAVTLPGRCISVAAGNAGQERAEAPGDIGWVMGRIHTSGQVPAAGLAADIEWEVVGDGRVDLSENELEIWYGAQDQFAVSVRPPGGDWIGPVRPREYIQNRLLPNNSVLSIYNEPYHPANGCNYIAIFLSPFLDDPPSGIATGRWTVRLHGLDVRDGRYHGWIERDDPRRMGRIGPRETWRFPSFFSERSNVDSHSVSTLACGQRVISVANLDDARERINITSSQGPTRDNRSKPDIAAPGTDIVAAYGFGDWDDEAQRWVRMTGTSMASPYVAGVVGLMLAIEPRLTAAQVEAILHRTARPLPGGDFTWKNDAGYGRIDADACLKEAAAAYNRAEIEP